MLLVLLVHDLVMPAPPPPLLPRGCRAPGLSANQAPPVVSAFPPFVFHTPARLRPGFCPKPILSASAPSSPARPPSFLRGRGERPLNSHSGYPICAPLPPFTLGPSLDGAARTRPSPPFSCLHGEGPLSCFSGGHGTGGSLVFLSTAWHFPGPWAGLILARGCSSLRPFFRLCPPRSALPVSTLPLGLSSSAPPRGWSPPAPFASFPAALALRDPPPPLDPAPWPPRPPWLLLLPCWSSFSLRRASGRVGGGLFFVFLENREAKTPKKTWAEEMAAVRHKETLPEGPRAPPNGRPPRHRKKRPCPFFSSRRRFLLHGPPGTTRALWR